MSTTTAAFVCLLTGACASGSGSGFEQASAGPEHRMCTVRVENGTDVPLELLYWVEGGVRGSLGPADPLQSVTFGVECDTGSIAASGFGSAQLGGPPRFRKVAKVAPHAEETVIKLTNADRMR